MPNPKKFEDRINALIYKDWKPLLVLISKTETYLKLSELFGW